MKKSLLQWTMGLLILAGCQDDKLDGGYPAAVGSEISFAANHAAFDFNEKTKTVYGERDGMKYPIYWENGDEIGIYCPQGALMNPDAAPQFDYKVLVENETSTIGTLAKINPGENGLQWGDNDTHDFYAIYPASASTKESSLSGTELKCSIPLLQRPNTIIYDPGTQTYTAYPNMEYAYMYAHTQVNRSTQGNNPIELKFKPLVTVLEITVNGPTATPTVGDYQISQVSIRCDNNITGNFKLIVSEPGKPIDPSKDGICEIIDDGTVSNLLTIPTYIDGKPITLKPGEKLVVKAFMLPHADINANTTAVTVNMVGSGSKTKLLTQKDIQARKINITSLPALPTTNDVNTYYWLSAMDKRTYVSQLSIPGSHNSYSIAENPANFRGTNTQMPDYQTKNIQEQFAFGARAFSFMVGFARNEYDAAVEVTDGYYLQESSTGWNNDNYLLYVYDGQEQTTTTLRQALQNYATMLSESISAYGELQEDADLKRECQEFIVLHIDYKQVTGGSVSDGTIEKKYTEVKRWIKEVDETLKEYSPIGGVNLVTNIGSGATIADLMGNIVVFINYQSPDLPEKEGAVSYGWRLPGGGWTYGEEYEGYTYTPSASNNYIFMRQVYNGNTDVDITSTFWGLNDRDFDFPYYMKPEGANENMEIWKQTLQRLDNPYMDYYPNADRYAGRIEKKIGIAKDFFQTAIENNTGEYGSLNNWYFNDLGGFCTVNESGSYDTNMGESGNTVVAAHEINGPIYQYLIDPNNNSGPLGVVLMNFLGEGIIDDVNNGNTDVYGEWLPQTIMENNFRFALKRAE